VPWEKACRYFSRLRTGILKNLVFNNIRGFKNLTIVLDHLGKMKPKFFIFLDSLRDHARLILIARTAQKKETGRLWMMLWGFEKIELPPLKAEEAKKLASYWLHGMEFGATGYTRWVHDVIRISHGNPGVLSGICEEIRKKVPTPTTPIHVRTLDIDRKINELLKDL